MSGIGDSLGMGTSSSSLELLELSSELEESEEEPCLGREGGREGGRRATSTIIEQSEKCQNKIQSSGKLSVSTEHTSVWICTQIASDVSTVHVCTCT